MCIWKTHAGATLDKNLTNKEKYIKEIGISSPVIKKIHASIMHVSNYFKFHVWIWYHRLYFAQDSSLFAVAAFPYINFQLPFW